jgi:hypothetical protein
VLVYLGPDSRCASPAKKYSCICTTQSTHNNVIHLYIYISIHIRLSYIYPEKKLDPDPSFPPDSFRLAVEPPFPEPFVGPGGPFTSAVTSFWLAEPLFPFGGLGGPITSLDCTTHLPASFHMLVIPPGDVTAFDFCFFLSRSCCWCSSRLMVSMLTWV